MNTMWKTGLQVGLVLLAGGALMLSGGVASAMPERGAARRPRRVRGDAAARDGHAARRARSLRVGVAAARSVRNPTTTADQPGRRHDPVGAGRRRDAGAGRRRQPAGAGRRRQPPGTGRRRQPAGAGRGRQSTGAGRGRQPTSAAARACRYPCLDVNLPGIRISIGDASPPTAVLRRADCLTRPVGSHGATGRRTRWGGDDSRSRAVRDVRAGVGRGRRADPRARSGRSCCRRCSTGPEPTGRPRCATPSATTPVTTPGCPTCWPGGPDEVGREFDGDLLGEHAARRAHADRRGRRARPRGRSTTARRWCTPTVATSAPGTTCWS